jgi:RNA polymerase sigma factor (sigma-70 family)
MDPFEDRTDEDLLEATRRDPEGLWGVLPSPRASNARLLPSPHGLGGGRSRSHRRGFRRRPRFVTAVQAGKTPAVAWLYGIAKNKLAASRARGRVEEGARRRISAEPLVLTDEAIERVEELADAERQAEVMRDLLGRLPPDQGEAVRSRVLEERDYGEIAEELECSQAVVRQRVSRALHSLRRDLQGKEQHDWQD